MDAHEELALKQAGGSRWNRSLHRGLLWLVYTLLQPVGEELDALARQ